MKIELSGKQQLTVASAVTIVSALVIVAALGGIFWLIGAFFAAFSNVFLPLAVAGVMALVVRPYYELLQRRLPPLIAVTVVFASVLIPIAVFAWTFGALLIEQLEGFFVSLPQYWERVVTFFRERSPRVIELLDRYQLRERLGEVARAQGSAMLQGLQSVGGGALTVGRGFLRGLGVVFTWAMVPVYCAFFLLTPPPRGGTIESALPFLKPETRKNVVFLVLEFVNILVAFFRGQLVIAFLQGLLYAIGFTVVGLRYGFVLGLVLGLLNIIPYLGAIIGLAITLPLAFFQNGGGLGTLLAVIVVLILVSMIEGYFLTPKIMGDRTGLHPMAIIVAIFFWGSALGGIAGMILAIPLTAFLVVFWRLARENYIDELV